MTLYNNSIVEVIMSKQTIHGDMFIIPNLYQPAAMVEERFRSFHLDQADRWAEDWEEFGCTVKNPHSTQWVQVWYTSEESEDWSNHRHPRIEGQLPSYIPAEWLENCDEGTIVAIATNQADLVLTCNQSDYRYRGFGTFAETLHYINTGYRKSYN